ncbi:MAG: SusC/RagA family TonB-linked outer membrane protein [Ginsengibacter sp.]
MKSLHQKCCLFSVLFLLGTTAFSQSKKIEGTVTSAENNSPLAGVSVLIKGANSGTQTGADGQFSIQASPKNVLTFSYSGYISKEITVGNATTVNIALSVGVDKLDEVVVVGYGSKNRRNVTSAISKLDKDVLANAPRSNLGSALQGSIAGLQVVNSTGQPGAELQLLLRGGTSLNSSNSPLVVVDGVIRSFNDIPAQDVESLEVLKDAAATAIYGARANNGVILITTKQGKSGKSEIGYKFTGSFNQRRQGYNYLDAKDYIFYNRQGNLNSGRTLNQVNSSRGYGLLGDSANRSSFDIKSYGPSTSYLLGQGWDTVGDPYGGTLIFKDHKGEIENLVFRNTFSQDHYIDVTGGNEKGKYYASFDYYKEDGVIVGSGYQRYSGSFNGSYKVKDNVEVSTGVTLSTSSQLGVQAGEINTLYRSLAIWPTFNPWIDSAKTKPNPGLSSSDGNPLYWLNKANRSNEVNRISGNASVKWDIVPHLYVKATGNIYLREGLDRSFQKATQNYSDIFKPVPTFSNTSRTSYSNFGREFQKQFNAIINYSNTFNVKHSVGAMFGTEYFDTKAYNMQVLGSLAPTDDITTANASTIFVAGDNYTTGSEYRIFSTFGRLSYDYDDRYLLTAVFRSDGISSLANKNRFGFFPGMSAGWNIHKESFFQNSGLSKFITVLKPRISYGENGNVAGLGRYEVQGGYGGQGLYNGQATFLNTLIINPNLKWEKSHTTDVGVDIGLFKNRITILYDYYKRKTSDLLTNLSLPDYTGFSSFRTNFGTYQNTGHEIAINANVINSPQGLRLDVAVNASFVKNKILQLPYNGQPNNRQGGIQVFDPKTGKLVWVLGLQEGHTIGDIYAFKQVSIFKDNGELQKSAGNRVDMIARISGPNSSAFTNKITPGDVNWLDVDKNDTIDNRDQVYIGNINPKWTGGFSTNLTYKNFNLYSRWDFAFGHTIYNDLVARTLGNYQGTFNYFDLQKKSWSPTNPDTDVPKVYYADQVSAPLGKKNYTRINNASANLNSNNSRFYEKGDYVALREVTLSYNFRPSLLYKTHVFKQARIYVSGNNLFYITKFTGPSPEPPVLDNIVTGIYRGTYPTPKSYVLGVQVSF